MWKEALLKNTTPVASTIRGEPIPNSSPCNPQPVTPDHELMSSSVGTTPGSAVPVAGGEVPPVEYFHMLRPTAQAGSVYDGTNSVTSTEFTFKSKASVTRSESWADDDDDFLDSVFVGNGAQKNVGGAKKGGWKAVNSGPGQHARDNGNKDSKGGGRGGQNHSRKGRGGGRFDEGPQASSAQPSGATGGGRFDALGSGAGSWRR